MGLKSFKHRLITSMPTPAIKSNIHTWFRFASLPTSVSKWPDFNVEDHHWQRRWRSVCCLSPRVRNAARSTPVHLWDSLGFTLEFCPTVSNCQHKVLVECPEASKKNIQRLHVACAIVFWQHQRAHQIDLVLCDFSLVFKVDIRLRVAYSTSLTWAWLWRGAELKSGMVFWACVDVISFTLRVTQLDRSWPAWGQRERMSSNHLLFKALVCQVQPIRRKTAYKESRSWNGLFHDNRTSKASPKLSVRTMSIILNWEWCKAALVEFNKNRYGALNEHSTQHYDIICCISGDPIWIIYIKKKEKKKKPALISFIEGCWTTEALLNMWEEMALCLAGAARNRINWIKWCHLKSLLKGETAVTTWPAAAGLSAAAALSLPRFDPETIWPKRIKCVTLSACNLACSSSKACCFSFSSMRLKDMPVEERDETAFDRVDALQTRERWENRGGVQFFFLREYSRGGTVKFHMLEMQMF